MRRADVSFWWPRFARFLAGAAGTIVTALTGVIRNKWLAHHLDTAGIGVLAQVLSGQVWIGTAAGLSLSLPVARAVGAAAGATGADSAGAGAEDRGRRAAWSAAFLATVAGASAAIVGMLTAPAISRLLLGTPEHATLVRLSMLGVIGMALWAPASGFFAGRSDVRAGLTFALAGSGGATLLAFVLVPRYGLVGAATAMTLICPLGLVGALIVHAPAHARAIWPRPAAFLATVRHEAGPLLSVAAAALTLSLLDLGTMVVLRAHYLRAHGLEANGLLQAALALSQQVGGVFYAYLAGYAFGKVSAIASVEGTRGVAAYTRRQWVPLMGLAALATGIAIVGAAPLLRLLYSSRFDAAEPLMAYALFGEFGRVALQTIALGALLVGGTRLWFTVGLVQPVVFALAYGLLTRAGLGVASLPVAYAAAGWIAFGAALARMARRGVGLDARGLALAAGAFVALGLLARWVAG